MIDTCFCGLVLWGFHPHKGFLQGGAAPLHPPLALKSKSKLFASALEARLAPVISAVFCEGWCTVIITVHTETGVDDPAPSL